nr:glutathione binding-like protein [Nannocystis pusilla]
MSITFYYTPNTSASRVHWVLEELGSPTTRSSSTSAPASSTSRSSSPSTPTPRCPPSWSTARRCSSRWRSSSTWATASASTRACGRASAPASTPRRWRGSWGSVTLGGTIFRIFHNTSEWFPADSRNALQAESAGKEFEAQLKILEQRLQGREYLLGDRFTLVDAANAAAIAWALSFIKVDTSGLSNLTAWLDRSTRRPANQAAHGA